MDLATTRRSPIFEPDEEDAMPDTTKVSWRDGMTFDAELDNHTITMDAHEKFGGRGLGARPKAILLPALAGCTGIPEGVQPVTGFELDRYLGTWYEIARLDHPFERGLSRVTAEYSRRDDGGVRVVYRRHEALSMSCSLKQVTIARTVRIANRGEIEQAGPVDLGREHFGIVLRRNVRDAAGGRRRGQARLYHLVLWSDRRRPSPCSCSPSSLPWHNTGFPSAPPVQHRHLWNILRSRGTRHP